MADEGIGQNFAWSVRIGVRGRIADFAQEAGIDYGHVHDLLCHLIFPLAAYREEDVSLFPEVFVMVDETTFSVIAPGLERIKIGSCAHGADGASHILKNCAALAIGGWSIYILRREDEFEYGLFRCGETPLSGRAADVVSNNEQLEHPVILLRNHRESTVEVFSGKGHRLEVRLTPEPDVLELPPSTIDVLARNVTSQCPNDTRDTMCRYFSNFLLEATRESHGSLIAVRRSGHHDVPKAFRDGQILVKPIDFEDPIARYESDHTPSALCELNVKSALLKGMLNTDGITLLTTDARVLGFRIFVKPTSRESHAFPNQGGARSRAFSILSQRVGYGRALNCAFFRSQDGTTMIEEVHDA